MVKQTKIVKNLNEKEQTKAETINTKPIALKELKPKKENLKELNINITILQNLGDLVSGLQENMTQNTLNNIPLSYIDPQVMLEYLIDNPQNNTENKIEIDNDVKSLATTNIDFLDGVPIVNGLPFWERLDCEPMEYYRLFKTYRDYKLTQSNRSFEKLETDTNIRIVYLYALSKVYHWRQRVNAFDIYQMVIIEQARNKQIDLMEGKHKKAAERIWEICTTYMEVMEETGLLATVSPKEMQGWAELAIKLERLSLGLSPDKPKSEIEKDKDKERKGNVINVTNIKTQQNQQNQLNLTNPIKIDSEKHKKYLQEVANTLLIASSEVINDGQQSTTIDSEPDVEARIDDSDE